MDDWPGVDLKKLTYFVLTYTPLSRGLIARETVTHKAARQVDTGAVWLTHVRCVTLIFINTLQGRLPLVASLTHTSKCTKENIHYINIFIQTKIKYMYRGIYMYQYAK